MSFVTLLSKLPLLAVAAIFVLAQGAMASGQSETFSEYLGEVYAMVRCKDDCASIHLLKLVDEYRYFIRESSVEAGPQERLMVQTAVDAFLQKFTEGQVRLEITASEADAAVIFTMAQLDKDYGLAGCEGDFTVDGGALTGGSATIVRLPLGPNARDPLVDSCIFMALTSLLDFKELYWIGSQDNPNVAKVLQMYWSSLWRQRTSEGSH